MKPQPNPNPTTDREVLLAAADLIRRRGHVRQIYGNEETGYCVYGAIGHVRGRLCSPFDADSVTGRLVKAIGLRDFLLSPSTQVVEWNDEEGRTAEEVVDVLEKAALS